MGGGRGRGGGEVGFKEGQSRPAGRCAERIVGVVGDISSRVLATVGLSRVRR